MWPGSNSRMRLFIAVPSHGMWEAAMAHSLAVTMAHLAASDGPEHMHLMRCESSKLASGRTDLAKAALEQGADRILWVDTDQIFRPQHVRALLAHDLDIVAVDYAKKIPSQESVCAALDGTVLKKGTGLEEVAHAGMGLMLVKTDVFRKVGLPWFQFQWNPVTQDDIGEDVFFCRKARAAGFKVFVDHDASDGIGHVGKFTYRVG